MNSSQYVDTLTGGVSEIGSESVERPVDGTGLERLSTDNRNQRSTDAHMDAADIRDTLAGYGSAFEALVKRHQDRVSARMWRFTRDEHHHADLVQEVFVQAYLSLGTFRGDAPFEHWLNRIATIVGYKYWKKLSRERSRPMIPLDEIKNLAQQEPENVDPEDASAMLHGLMQRLAPRDRLVLMLRYMEGRSVQQTAQLTGWTQSLVKVQAWRARKKLKKLFLESGLEVDS